MLRGLILVAVLAVGAAEPERRFENRVHLPAAWTTGLGTDGTPDLASYADVPTTDSRAVLALAE